jgi:hypothetical protein
MVAHARAADGRDRPTLRVSRAPGRYGAIVPSSRIELDPEEVAGLIRGSRLLELRPDTPPEVRRRYTDTALTAMDALCGLAERRGTDGVWDALELVTHRELLAFATLMASELAETDFALGLQGDADTPGGADAPGNADAPGGGDAPAGTAP